MENFKNVARISVTCNQQELRKSKGNRDANRKKIDPNFYCGAMVRKKVKL